METSHVHKHCELLQKRTEDGRRSMGELEKSLAKANVSDPVELDQIIVEPSFPFIDLKPFRKNPRQRYLFFNDFLILFFWRDINE